MTKVVLVDQKHPITRPVREMNVGDCFIEMNGVTFYGPYRITEIRNGRKFVINLLNDSVPFDLDESKVYTPVEIESIGIKRIWA
jgi:hypothetical protein